jgi:hypothetical protein
MDHDAADRPGNTIPEMIAQMFRGTTHRNHYPSQEDATARVQRDIAPTAQGGGGARDLRQLGRDLHSLEDVGTHANPGPHNRNPAGGEPVRDASESFFAVGVAAGGLAAGGVALAAYLGSLASVRSVGGVFAGIGAVVAGIVAGLLAALAIFAIVFSFTAMGTGHPWYRTERGAQSTFMAHTADQFYQDPEANRREMLELYGILRQAARARYGRDVASNEQLARDAIDQLANATDFASIDAFMRASARDAQGNYAPSYTDIVSDQGTWRVLCLDVTVTGVDESYGDYLQGVRVPDRCVAE